LRPQPSGETREAVARVIDPDAYDNLGGTLSSVRAVSAESKADRILALLSARPLALGGQHSTPTDFPPDDVLACDTTPARAEAQDEGALSVLDRLLNYSGARGSFDAMKHGDAVKDAEELLRSVKSPSHTDLMVTPESIDAYMKVNPMEAQDEGAAGELKPCPFCGGPAKMIETMGEWVGKGKGVDGGAYGPPNHRVVCAALYESPIRPCSGRASPSTEQKAIAAWNARAHPSPTPAADADRVRIAVEAFNAKINAPLTGPTHGAWDRGRIAGLKEALAALKSTAAKEGGE
ncbi:Lar family restriction alleviation protein, partial [Brevundimonas sp.]|uniref:Lar family restriction alleviation protein n=1 Tax=Brevundimonas sp. TaxID=1871086 RepID=UPI0028A921A7